MAGPSITICILGASFTHIQKDKEEGTANHVEAQSFLQTMDPRRYEVSGQVISPFWKHSQDLINFVHFWFLLGARLIVFIIGYTYFEIDLDEQREMEGDNIYDGIRKWWKTVTNL